MISEYKPEEISEYHQNKKKLKVQIKWVICTWHIFWTQFNQNMQAE